MAITAIAAHPTARAPRRPAMRGPSAMPKNVTTDVRKYIPDTPQTNAAHFPGYEHREYPKMMLATIKDEKGRTKEVPYIDEETQEPILVYDEEEEAEFREANPDAVKTPINSSRLNQQERAELEELRKMKVVGTAGDAASGDEGDTGNRLTTLTNNGNKRRGGQILKDRSGERLPDNMD